MRGAEVVQTGRTPTEVRLRLGVVCGALAVVAYALTQAVTLPLRPSLVLVCAFGPLLGLPGRQRPPAGAGRGLGCASGHRHRDVSLEHA